MLLTSEFSNISWLGDVTWFLLFNLILNIVLGEFILHYKSNPKLLKAFAHEKVSVVNVLETVVPETEQHCLLWFKQVFETGKIESNESIITPLICSFTGTSSKKPSLRLLYTVTLA